METVLDLHKNYRMLIYLAKRGALVDQLKACSDLWDQLLDTPYDREGFRSLRIELRRLRSALALLKSLLPEDGEAWLAQLKLRSNQLGNVRDYDVALQACFKYEAYVLEQLSTGSEESKQYLKELPRLKAMLLKERETRVEFFNTDVRPGCIAQDVASCLEVLKNSVELSLEEEATANALLQSSLQLWGLKLGNKLQNLDKLKTAEQLHKLRIKVKRFRYAYEVYMETALDRELLLKIKEFQDILGSLHDGDRNLELISESLAVVEMDDELAKEVACFKAWREIKKQQRMEQLQPAALQLLASLQDNIVGTALL